MKQARYPFASIVSPTGVSPRKYLDDAATENRVIIHMSTSGSTLAEAVEQCDSKGVWRAAEHRGRTRFRRARTGTLQFLQRCRGLMVVRPGAAAQLKR